MLAGSIHHLGKDYKSIHQDRHETRESQGHGCPDHKGIIVRGMWDGKKAEDQIEVMESIR